MNKNKIKLIVEVGSGHRGEVSRGVEFIRRAKDIRAWAVKFQLFPNKEQYTGCGNIHLSLEKFSELYEYGRSIDMPVTASVFGKSELEFLEQLNPLFIKLSYSKSLDTVLYNKTQEYIVSGDVMNKHLLPTGKHLYCIPEYPVRYEVAFDKIFVPVERGGYGFDGFSDHTLGVRQTKRAIKAGAKIIEKHVKLEEKDNGCPDDRFAVSFKELEDLWSEE